MEQPSEKLSEKIDRLIYRVEKVLVVGSLLVMSVLVFMDVVHRRYSDPESKLSSVLAGIMGIGAEDAAFQTVQALSPWLNAGCFFFLFWLGISTASTRPMFGAQREEDETRRPSKLKAAGLALGMVVACAVVLRVAFGSGGHSETCAEQGFSLECGLFPSGLIWSQPVALVLTIWVGFIGASMATRDHRHLKVEAVQQRLSEGLRRKSSLVAGLFTALFCLLVAYLSWHYVLDQRSDYIGSDGLGGVFDGLPVPRWIGFLVLPVAYLLMAGRFVLAGLKGFRGEQLGGMGELGDLDLDALAVDVPEDDPTSAASEGEVDA
ncbi:MAG: TRAP transporter small permease [Nannocystaceae bacterium]